MGLLPGVSAASWSKQRRGLPLIAEAAGSALVGFLIGLLLAQLIEVRRRNRASWE